jgi:hypothetical protein
MNLIDEVCKLSADNKDSHYTLIVQKIVDGIKKKAIKGKTHYNFREMKKWQKLSKKDRKKIKKYFENEGFFVNDLSCNYDEDDDWNDFDPEWDNDVLVYFDWSDKMKQSNNTYPDTCPQCHEVHEACQ